MTSVVASTTLNCDRLKSSNALAYFMLNYFRVCLVVSRSAGKGFKFSNNSISFKVEKYDLLVTYK